MTLNELPMLLGEVDYGNAYLWVAFILNRLREGAEFVASILTIALAISTFYVYLKNRKRISTALDSISKFALQGTLTGLRQKLERLTEYDADDPQEAKNVSHIFHEIAGQLSGNNALVDAYPNLAKSVEGIANSRKLTEALKLKWYERLKELVSNIETNRIHKQEPSSD